MQRINGPNATTDQRFRDEDLAHGIGPTVWTTPWLNTVQDEIANVPEAAGIELEKGTNDQLLAAIAILAGDRGFGRNLFVNGAFAIWQRDTAASSGVSIAVTAAAGEKYVADRWFVRADDQTTGAGQVTCSRQPFTPGQTDVPGEPEFFLRFVQATPASLGNSRIGQKVEDVARTAGRPLVFSCWVKASAAIAAAFSATQNFGVGGSASTITASHSFSLTTSYQRLEFAFTPDDLAGATIGPASYLECSIHLPAGIGYTVELFGAQLEPGSQPSSFERRPRSLELRLAQRYYEKSWDVETPVGTATEIGTIAGTISNASLPIGTNNFDRALSKRFAVPKRAPPTLTWYSETGVAGKYTQVSRAPYTGGGTNTEHNVLATVAVSELRTGYPRTGLDLSSAGGGWPIASVHFVADAEL